MPDLPNAAAEKPARFALVLAARLPRMNSLYIDSSE